MTELVGRLRIETNVLCHLLPILALHNSDADCMSGRHLQLSNRRDSNQISIAYE